MLDARCGAADEVERNYVNKETVSAQAFKNLALEIEVTGIMDLVEGMVLALVNILTFGMNWEWLVNLVKEFFSNFGIDSFYFAFETGDDGTKFVVDIGLVLFGEPCAIGFSIDGLFEKIGELITQVRAPCPSPGPLPSRPTLRPALHPNATTATHRTHPAHGCSSHRTSRRRWASPPSRTRSASASRRPSTRGTFACATGTASRGTA